MFWWSNLYTVFSWETKTISITHCNLRLHLWEKTPPEECSSTSLERPLSGTANQHFAAKFQGKDTWIRVTLLEKVLYPDWNCTSFGDLKVKISQN